jgi:hypothetical protein
MGLFGKRHQEERTPPKEATTDVGKAIAAISARQRFLDALLLELVKELSPKKRDNLLIQLKEDIGGLVVLPPPSYVPSDNQQDFQDELRRAMKVLIEKATWPRLTG